MLRVNYCRSIGYGQKFAGAVFGDQDGNEVQDVFYGVSAAARHNLWIDRNRIGIEGTSNGGMLTEWLITQTKELKAAIPTPGMANLIRYNYATDFNQYEEMELGQFLHQGNLMEFAWEPSALRRVGSVFTPAKLMHGGNDSDFPIEKSEQYYVTVKKVRVETIIVRYPCEGHGLRETQRIIDSIDCSSAWYEKHFLAPRRSPTRTCNSDTEVGVFDGRMFGD